MKLKKFLITAIALIFMNASASAQVVTVQGSGGSEVDAIKDAKRNAVEKVIGTKIQSESLNQGGRVKQQRAADAKQRR